MNTITGSFDPGSVSFGRTIFKFRQSSEVLVVFERVRGGPSEMGTCGHAGPKEVASIVVSLSGTYGRGGLKRFSPDVSCPNLKFVSCYFLGRQGSVLDVEKHVQVVSRQPVVGHVTTLINHSRNS